MLEVAQQDVIALDELGEKVVRINPRKRKNKPKTEKEKPNANNGARNWSTRFGKELCAWPSLVLPK